MRTTMNTVYAKTIANLNKLTADMDDINTRLSSGSSLNKISDNPVNMVSALNLRSSLAEINQYQDNLQYGNTMITAGESALTQIKEQVQEAKVIAIEAQNPAVTTNRSSIAPKVDNLITQSVTLANTQINGKYIFGGFRTSGYTEKEPAPFIQDFVDGYRLNGTQPDTLSQIPMGWTPATGEVQVPAVDTTVNTLEIVLPSTATTLAVPPFTIPASDVNGLNMTGADNLQTAINGLASPDITADLTTLISGGPTSANGPTDQVVDFTINGALINYSLPANATAAEVAQLSVDAINTVSSSSGVQAEVGDDSNGGVAGSIVLRNIQQGDGSLINIVGIDAVEGPILNLVDTDSSAADATHNTGQVSVTSPTGEDFTFGNTSQADLLLTGLSGGTTITMGSVVQDGTDLNAGDLIFVNDANPSGVQVGAVDLTNSGSTRYGINPVNTTNLRDAINAISTTSGVDAFATTQVGGHIAAADTPTTTPISFTLVGSGNSAALPVIPPVDVNFDAQGTATEVAQQTIEAINAVSGLTGIEAIRGNNANGGIDNSIILRNIQNGDEGEITIAGVNGTESAILGFSDADSVTGADFDNNTGEIFLSSPEAFNYGDGNPVTSTTTLQITGLLNSTVAPNSVNSLGTTDSYSTHQTGTLGMQDLRINGIWVPAAENDGISSALPEFSAAAKAAAINSISDETGVTAEITPPKIYAGGAVAAGTLQSGDIIINGVDIFTDPAGTNIVDQDIDNTFIDAINARQDDTGVVATRTGTGALVLKAVDGRNIQIETTENGEAVGHINGTLPTSASSDIYIGQVQIISDRSYMLESPVYGPSNLEAGLIALGLDGGAAVTGEPADEIGDGKISALRIIDQPGNIRYTGDRHSSLEIKVGKVEKLTIARNGQEALMDTRVFDELQNLEDTLLGINYTEVTSLYRGQDLTATLDSGDTGFSDGIYEYTAGSFDITITDHDHQPPQTFTMAIGVDPAEDSLTSVADKLNGVPGLNAHWDADNYLVIETDDPDRYTMKIDNDSSHFTDIVNITSEDMQVHGLDNSIAALDIIMESLTTQISDFGARSNRIDVQNQIFTNLDISTQENLSEKQDTDFIKAVMDLKAKEVAYQAALSSAAKIMQLSLVDYLK